MELGEYQSFEGGSKITVKLPPFPPTLPVKKAEEAPFYHDFGPGGGGHYNKGGPKFYDTRLRLRKNKIK